MYVCIYVYMHTYICMHIYIIHIHVYVCIYTYMHTYICMHIYEKNSSFEKVSVEFKFEKVESILSERLWSESLWCYSQ